jgi:hypothetical protein
MKGRPLSLPTLDRLTTGIGGALIVSLLFFPIYLGCAAITAARSNPLHLYAQWELSIPFWPFMVVPYLSMFLLFVTPPRCSSMPASCAIWCGGSSSRA